MTLLVCCLTSLSSKVHALCLPLKQEILLSLPQRQKSRTFTAIFTYDNGERLYAKHKMSSILGDIYSNHYSLGPFSFSSTNIHSYYYWELGQLASQTKTLTLWEPRSKDSLDFFPPGPTMRNKHPEQEHSQINQIENPEIDPSKLRISIKNFLIKQYFF